MPTVPNLKDHTVVQALKLLAEANLKVGKITEKELPPTQAEKIVDTSPISGSDAADNSEVNLTISSGAATRKGLGRFLEFFSVYDSQLSAIVYSIIVIALVALIAYGSYYIIKRTQESIAQDLIAFIIVISTVGIGFILMVSTLLVNKTDDADKRFDRGKQIFTSMLGILGTIVGFYFANSDKAAGKNTAPFSVEDKVLDDAKINTEYKSGAIPHSGGTAPLAWSITPDLPSGLKLDSASGEIKGLPTAVSPMSRYTITVTDGNTPSHTKTANISLQVK